MPCTYKGCISWFCFTVGGRVWDVESDQAIRHHTTKFHIVTLVRSAVKTWMMNILSMRQVVV